MSCSVIHWRSMITHQESTLELKPALTAENKCVTTFPLEKLSINSCGVYCSVTYWLNGRARPVTIKATAYIMHWPRKTQAQLLLVTDHHASVYPNSARPDEKDTITIPVKEFASVFDLSQPLQWKWIRLWRWSLSGKKIALPSILRRATVNNISIQG